ncbi:hypothetical protein QL285_081821 [Trifolium repens]|nr:hypothetical protein QL285_081821 [Trifolium repens]
MAPSLQAARLIRTPQYSSGRNPKVASIVSGAKLTVTPPDIRSVILSSICHSIGIKLLNPRGVALPQHVVEGHPSVPRSNLSHPWKWVESVKINTNLMYQPLILNRIIMLPGNTAEEARRNS